MREREPLPTRCQWLRVPVSAFQNYLNYQVSSILKGAKEFRKGVWGARARIELSFVSNPIIICR